MKRVIFNIMILSLAGNLVDAEVQHENTPVSSDITSPPALTKQKDSISKNLITPAAPPLPKNERKSTIPPPPMNGTPPPPPPPSPSGTGIPNSSVRTPVTTVVDVQKILENPKKILEKIVEENDIKLVANTINLYLSGYAAEISDAIKLGTTFSEKLSENLNKDIEILSKTLEDLKKNQQAETNAVQKVDLRINLLSDLIVETKPDTTNETTGQQSDTTKNLPPDYRPFLKKLDEQIKLLSTNTYRDKNSSPSQTFNKVKNEIEVIARSYFETVQKSREAIKKSPIILKTLEDVEVIIEKAIILSNSFCNLLELLNEPSNKEFNDYKVKDILRLINIKKEIATRVKKLEDEENDTSKNKPLSTNRFITLPTGETIRELDLLKKVISLFRSTLTGTDKLKEIFKIKDILNHKFTTVNGELSNKEIDTLSLIKTLKTDYLKLGVSITKAYSKENKNNYSQIGSMFSLSNKKYGGSLVRSVHDLLETSNSVKFEEDTTVTLKYDSNQKLDMNSVKLSAKPEKSYHTLEFNERSLRNAFQYKNLTNEFFKEYFSLLSVEGNFCPDFTQATIKFLAQKTNFKVSAYSSAAISMAKKAENQKEKPEKQENEQTILQFLFPEENKPNSYISLGTSRDPQKPINLIALSQLQNNCMEYVDTMDNMLKDLKDVPTTLEEISMVSSKITADQVSKYINKILGQYLVSESELANAGYAKEDSRILLKILNLSDKGNISPEHDTPNAVFALAQNCDLIINNPLPLTPASSPKDDNYWILSMSQNLSKKLDEAIDILTDEDNKANIKNQIEPSDINKIESVFKNTITQLSEIKLHIDESISRAKRKKEMWNNIKFRLDEAISRARNRIKEQQINKEGEANDIIKNERENKEEKFKK